MVDWSTWAGTISHPFARLLLSLHALIPSFDPGDSIVGYAQEIEIMTTQDSADRRPQLMTIEQVAERLGVSVRTVWTLIAAGDLPTVKVRKSTRIEVGDLDHFVRLRRSRAQDGA